MSLLEKALEKYAQPDTTASDQGLREILGDDWDEVSSDPAQLAAARFMVATAKQIEAGQIPEHFTNVTNCHFCGPVYVYPGFPPEAQSCPWCRNRYSGQSIPKANVF